VDSVGLSQLVLVGELRRDDRLSEHLENLIG